MRIFVYEYTCAVPDASGAASLRAEGAAMLAAVLEDLRRLPHVELLTLIDACDEETQFRDIVRRADCALVIAPETGGILAERCRWVTQEKRKRLGPSLDAIETCSDKLRLAEVWQCAGVLTPATSRWTESHSPSSNDLVIKPRFGAGCAATFRVDPRSGRFQPPRIAAAGSRRYDEMIVQPWIDGIAASVSFLIGPKLALPLLPVRQHIVADGPRLKYAGGSLPLRPELASRAERIARHAVVPVPGLLGYIGVDVVLGDDGRDWAIEINPRLTTSYVGLRRLCQSNLMAALLAVMNGETPDLAWRSEIVTFTTDGQVSIA